MKHIIKAIQTLASKPIKLSDLNSDERKMINSLSGSQIKMIAKDPHGLQRLGEIFDEDKLDKLGIDPNASFDLDKLLEKIKFTME